MDFLPMKHSEFVRLTQKLLGEADQFSEDFQLYATPALRLDPQEAMKVVNSIFFINLLDAEDAPKNNTTISLTSSKLRHILAKIKELHNEEQKGEAPVQGLSPSSRFLLSFLNNVLTCFTGKEDGIDQTYRSLTNRRGSTENEMHQQRLEDDMHEFFKEEMRCAREKSLDFVVRSLFHPTATQEELKAVVVDEAPHQTKYVHNLLGTDIGLFLEGKGITFDGNAGCVSLKLREHKKQAVLDTLYEFHAPKKAIHDFLEGFNGVGMRGKIDGKNETFKIICELLTPEQQQDPHYIIYDDAETPQGLSPLGVAEMLIGTKILHILEK
jgi:hypothetical protein